MASSKRPPPDPKTGQRRRPASQRPTRIVDIRELQPRLVDKLVIPHPRSLSPDAETNVPCPVCHQGMVAASVAGHVASVLREVGDGPLEPDPPPPRR